MKKYLIAVLLLSSIACTKTKISFESENDCDIEVTYNDQMRDIIDRSCAYANCHVGVAPGDFSSFDGIQEYVENSSANFTRRTIQLQDMPPSYAPEGKPKELTEEEMELLDCWAQGGYKE